MTLLDEVNLLTQSQVHRVHQAAMACRWPQERNEWGDRVEPELVQVGRFVTKTYEKPLLIQLASSIAADLGGSTGGASQAHTRSILNADSFELWLEISSSIRAWRTKGFHLEPSPDSNTPSGLSADIREFYRVLVAYPHTQTALDDFESEFRRWNHRIRAKFGSVRESVLVDVPCPECDATGFWMAGELYRHPLVVRYLPGSTDLVGTARGHCRACEAGWTARALADAIGGGGGARLAVSLAVAAGVNVVLE